MLASNVLGSELVKVCFRRIHGAPSILRGPDSSRIVAISCVVTACVRPAVESQDSGFSEIRTAPTSGGMWHHLRARSDKIKLRVLHPGISAHHTVDILRGLPEGSRLSPTLFGGFLIISKMSSFSRFLSFRIAGSLDVCGTENLSLSGFRFLISSCSSPGCSPPHVWRIDSIFSLICVVGSV